MTAPAASPSKVRPLLTLWSLALALSAALVAAGERWPQPLRPDPVTVAALVLGVPLGVALLVLLRWRLPTQPEGGAAGHRGESSD